MKKSLKAILLTLPFLLASCQGQTRVYSDDLPILVNVESRSLTMLQFTDLHLTYGFDQNDKHTLKMMKTISQHVKPDLIVLTGDQTLSVSAVRLYKKLTRHMESLAIPWTFVFGNHDTDYHSYMQIYNAVKSVPTTYLKFKPGPQIEDGGFGNFALHFAYDEDVFYKSYFFDSKAEQKTFKPTGFSGYEWLSENQVSWYAEKVEQDKLDNIRSTTFMHIPLVQYMYYKDFVNTPSFTGEGKENIFPQAVDTGFYKAMVDSGVSDGVFVGHDHVNNFTVMMDGIILGYGQNSGFNGYGRVRRGGRVIHVNADGEYSTNVIYEDLTYAN